MLLIKIIGLYQIVFIVRCFLSLFPHDRNHSAVVFLHKITDPLLEPIRRVIPPMAGMIDFSPLVVILGLELIKRIL